MGRWTCFRQDAIKNVFDSEHKKKIRRGGFSPPPPFENENADIPLRNFPIFLIGEADRRL